MNRIDRLAAIVIQLQSKKLVKACEIADKFSISLRTVYRDIHALEAAGIPVIGEAGVGYQLMEGYKLPPVMFSEEEASAMLTGAKLMQKMSDERLWKHYSSALDKIKAVLRLAQKDYLEEIDAHIAVISHPSHAHNVEPQLYLPELLKAIATSSVIEINYTSFEKRETLLRKVEPVGIYYQGANWYLVGYCLLRKDYRNFRTDKINKFSFTPGKQSQKHPPLQKFITKTTQQQGVQQVVIEVEKNIVHYLGEQKYYNGFVKEEEAGNMIRLTFLCGSLEGFARWFMWFGDKATILEPIALKEEVIKIGKDILHKVKNSELLLT